MKATHTADLNLDHIPLDLPPSTKHSSVFKELQHKALIWIAQFYDAGYEAIFDELAAYLEKKALTIVSVLVQETKLQIYGLWIQLPKRVI